jgi:hypothetical protein
MKKTVSILLASILTLTLLAGCMGHNGLSRNLRDFNLDVVENRWAREGIFILLFPVNYVFGWVDIFVLNAIEFWSGTNPVTGDSPAVVDMEASLFEERGINHVAFAQMRYLNDEIQMHIVYKDGTDETLTAQKQDDLYSFFRGDEPLLELRAEELRDYRSALNAQMEVAKRNAPQPEDSAQP